MPEINHVLNEAIADLSFGQIYDLARGLMLSTVTKEEMLDLLFKEMDVRRTVTLFETPSDVEKVDQNA